MAEVPADKLYRVARVELLHEQPVADEGVERGLRQQLGELLRRWFAAESAAQEQLRKLLQSRLALGTLCDIFGFALPFEPAIKQQLLEEVGVARRVERLLRHLGDSAITTKPDAVKHRFPPNFSPN